MTRPSPNTTRWHIDDYFVGFIAGIMNYDSLDDALGASSRDCLNQESVVETLSGHIELLEDKLRANNIADWKWNDEYYDIVKTICDIYL